MNCPNARPIITTARNIEKPINAPFKVEDIALPLENPILLQLRFSILVAYMYIPIGTTANENKEIKKLSILPKQ